MRESLKDNQDKIERVERNLFRVPHYHMPNSECEVNGQKYAEWELPGITGKDLTGVSPFYHEIGGDKVPKLMIKRKALFRIEQESDYGNDGNLLRVITSLEEAKRVLDAMVKRDGNYKTESNSRSD